MAQARLAALLRGGRAARGAAELDGRPRRAPDRRRAAGAQGAVAAGRDALGDRGRPRPLAHHQRLPAQGPGRRPRPRRPQAHQRLARLARARPLLPAHPPRLAGAGARGPRGRRVPPRAAPDQGQRRRAQGLHRGRGRALRRLRPPHALRRALHRVHAARRRPLVERRQGAAQRGDPAPDQRGPSARGRRPRAPRHLAALALRRRAGRDRLHLPRLRAVLRRLQPHPPDRRGDAPDLPLLAQRDRPARADARGRERRGDRAIIRDAVWRKELKHHIGDEGFVQPARSMSRIGG